MSYLYIFYSALPIMFYFTPLCFQLTDNGTNEVKELWQDYYIFCNKIKSNMILFVIKIRKLYIIKILLLYYTFLFNTIIVLNTTH